MAEAVGSFEERSALRRRLESYVAVQDLAPNTWLLRSSADEAGEDVIVAAELLKPALSSKEPAVLRNLLDKALCEANSTAQWFCNDRYFKQTVPGAADVCLEIVCPATAKDIAKRRAVPLERCLETQALYDSVTVPGTLVGAAARDKWVANIIEGKSEQEHVVAELSCEGLVVVKDYKWQNIENVNDLYYLSLFSDLSIRSLRDLSSQHVPLLRRILDQVLPGLAQKHGVPPVSLIAYVHYHPTFWYFHVHIVNSRHSMFSTEGVSWLAPLERFHKLETVVALLEANGDYYASATLPLLIKEDQAALYKT